MISNLLDKSSDSGFFSHAECFGCQEPAVGEIAVSTQAGNG